MNSESGKFFISAAICHGGEVYKHKEELTTPEEWVKATNGISRFCPNECYLLFGVNDCQIKKQGRFNVQNRIDIFNF